MVAANRIIEARLTRRPDGRRDDLAPTRTVRWIMVLPSNPVCSPPPGHNHQLQQHLEVEK